MCPWLAPVQNSLAPRTSQAQSREYLFYHVSEEVQEHFAMGNERGGKHLMSAVGSRHTNLMVWMLPRLGLCCYYAAHELQLCIKWVLVVVLKRIFYINESKVGGFLVCLRDCFNQVKINKDRNEGQRHRREVPSQETSVLHNYNCHLFTVSHSTWYNPHTFSSYMWLRASKSPLTGAAQNESCDAQRGSVTKNQSSHSLLFYVQRHCRLTWLHHVCVTCPTPQVQNREKRGWKGWYGLTQASLSSPQCCCPSPEGTEIHSRSSH